MRRQNFMSSRWGQAAVIAGAFLVLVAGFCMVARDLCGMDDDSLSQMVCAGVGMLLSAAILLAAPLLNGWFLSVPGRSRYMVSLNLLDPPPKYARLP